MEDGFEGEQPPQPCSQTWDTGGGEREEPEASVFREKYRGRRQRERVHGRDLGV